MEVCIGCEVLKPPIRAGADSIQKGVIILTFADEVCRARPDIRDFFYIVERRGASA